MDLDILSQIPRLLKELIALVKEPFDIRKKKRHDFFDTEILTIHKTVSEIHEDYMKSFSELLELLKTEGDINKTIELLRKKRLALITKRQDVLAFSKEIEHVKKRSYLKSREIELFVKYAESIRAYLQSATPVDMRVSWYSGFIAEFESLARRGQSPYKSNYTSISSGTPPIDLVRNAYSSAVHTDIPNSWRQYSEAYNKLRLDFTR